MAKKKASEATGETASETTVTNAIAVPEHAGEQLAQKKAEPVGKAHHIIELLVENIMKVRVAHIRPKGNVIQLTGKNGQGKTSVLNAITWALTGTGDIPSQPIRAGQRVGVIKMDLGDLVVTRHFTRVDPDKSEKGNTYFTKLMVEGKHREQFRSPQMVLNALMGKLSFDPLSFTRMDDVEQVKTMFSLVQFDIDIAALDAAQVVDFEDRRIAGRELGTLEARFSALDVPAAGLPDAPIDTSEITKRMEGAANHNSIVAAQRQRKAQLGNEIDANRAKAAELRNKAVDLLSEAARLDGMVYDVKPKNVLFQPNGNGRLSALSAAITPGDEIDVAALVLELNAANRTNRDVAAASAYRIAEKELIAARDRWRALDEAIEARKAERSAAMPRAKMPTDGLSIGDGEVLYNGLPFRQASNAEQIRVSMAMAMASNPKLRVLRIADGSLLDSESLALISQEADKNGFQVWIERVDTGGAVGVLMEEGEASGDEVVGPVKTKTQQSTS